MFISWSMPRAVAEQRPPERALSRDAVRQRVRLALGHDRELILAVRVLDPHPRADAHNIIRRCLAHLTCSMRISDNRVPRGRDPICPQEGGPARHGNDGDAWRGDRHWPVPWRYLGTTVGTWRSWGETESGPAGTRLDAGRRGRRTPATLRGNRRA